MATGPLGTIPSMEDWRLEQLRKHNIDFSSAFPKFPELKINSLATCGKPSLFKQGLLCANRLEKGPVLIAFLESVEWKPSKVLFLDNRLDYLQSVEKSLESTGIEFIGFYYSDVDDRPCIVNEDVVKFQIMHLAKTGVWLSDHEALEQR